MSRCAMCAVCLFVVSAQASLADVSPSVTREDYARAERFLLWNKDDYVVNADIQHHWIGGQDRFWYTRRNPSGDKEFIVFDAQSTQRVPAFDHVKLAAALSKASKTSVNPSQLPFSRFSYSLDGMAIRFEWEDSTWNCHLKPYVCEGAAVAVAPGEVVSPNGQWAAFLRDNNLWIRPTDGAESFPLTTDGVEHYAYAGSPGYSTHAVSDQRSSVQSPPQIIWSPNSRFLLTHRLDERKVKELNLIQSVPEDGGTRPRMYSYRYAMPGDEDVPMLEPLVFEVITRRRIELATSPLYCSVQTWIEQQETWWSTDSTTIYFLSRDRFARSIALHRGDPLSGSVHEILRRAGEGVLHTNASSVFDTPLVRVLSNGDFIWYSQQDGWGHLYYYNAKGALKNQITNGEWVVRDIVRVDEATRTVYFMASGRESGRDPYEQSMYSIRFDGGGLHLLTPEAADHKWPHYLPLDGTLSQPSEQARFSRSGRYFVDSYSRPDLPPTLVLRSAEGQLIKQLEQADISRLRLGGYTPIESFSVLAADGKTPIYGNLFRPSTFNPAHRYPVIDASYPGPQMIRAAKQFVAATFDQFEAQSLAELGFIVVTIDGRGTPHRSREFLEYSYGRLDRASDLEDHLAGIRQLARRYPYMDLSRVGIDGVSAGGTMAAQAILKYPGFYKVAVAAEGNHDPRTYLAPWSEAYVGPYEERDYESYATSNLAANLKGKLLLMHGEMDDNVSPTSTLRLVDALIKANRDFDLLILPNASHAAFLTSPYFIRRKWDYFVRNLMQAQPPEDYSIKYPQ